MKRSSKKIKGTAKPGNILLEKLRKFGGSFLLGVITTICVTLLFNGVDGILHPKYDTGDVIELGKYEQDGNLSNGTEPIEWYVIGKEDDKYLLLSKYILDARAFHSKKEDITWEKCSLRQWLNNDFLQISFTPSESKKIVSVNNINKDNSDYETKGGNTTNDKVFLLSIDDAKKYLTSDIAFATSTRYAFENGAFTFNPNDVDENTDSVLIFKFENGKNLSYGITKETDWFLRSPGYSQDSVSRIYNSFYSDAMSNVGVYIDDMGIFVNNPDQGLRPAIWYEP